MQHRFFMTRYVEGLAPALNEAGHLIVSTEADRDAVQVPAKVSPIGSLLKGSNATVALIVDPLRPGWGYPRHALQTWAGKYRHRDGSGRRRVPGMLVALALNDPVTWEVRRPENCVARVNDFAVYATADAGVAAVAARRMRTVHWTGPESVPALLRAMEHAGSGQIYRGREPFE